MSDKLPQAVYHGFPKDRLNGGVFISRFNIETSPTSLRRAVGKVNSKFSHIMNLGIEIAPIKLESVSCFKDALMSDIGSNKEGGSSIQSILQRVSSEKEMPLHKIVEDCLKEFDSLSYELSKQSESLGFVINADFLKTALAKEKKISEEIAALAVKLAIKMQDKPFTDCVKEVFSQYSGGSLSSILQTISYMKIHKDLVMLILGRQYVELLGEPLVSVHAHVSESELIHELERETAYWTLYEWMPSHFRSKILDQHISPIEAAKECILEIESQTNVSKKDILRMWIKNFSGLNNHIVCQLSIAEKLDETKEGGMDFQYKEALQRLKNGLFFLLSQFSHVDKGAMESRPIKSEGVVHFVEALIREVKSTGGRERLVLSVLQKVSLEKKIPLYKLIEECLCEFENLCYELTKQSGSMGLEIDADFLESALAMEQAFSEEVSELTVKLAMMIKDKPLKEGLKALFSQYVRDGKSSILKTLFYMNAHKDLVLLILGNKSTEVWGGDRIEVSHRVSESALMYALEKEYVRWTLYEWMLHCFQSRVLDKDRSWMTALKECVVEIEFKTNYTKQQILSLWAENFDELKQCVIARLSSTENKGIVDGSNVAIQCREEMGVLREIVYELLEQESDVSVLRSRDASVCESQFQDKDLQLSLESQHKLYTAIQFMGDLAGALMGTNSERARSYGKILQSIYLACKQMTEAKTKVDRARKTLSKVNADRLKLRNKFLDPKMLEAEQVAKERIATLTRREENGEVLSRVALNQLETDYRKIRKIEKKRSKIDVESEIPQSDRVREVEAELTIQIAESLKIVTRDDLVFEFNSVLSLEERRLLNEGHSKMAKIAKGKERIKRSEIGEGVYGAVFYALNITKFVRSLDILKMGTLCEKRNIFVGSYVGIVREVARGNAKLTSSETSFLTKTLKACLRDARIAEKKMTIEGVVDPDVVTALSGCASTIVPRTEREDLSILELASTDLGCVKMKTAQALEATVALALGLKEMHDRGVIHRDIKPKNLVLLKKGDFSSVKFIDFDLSLTCSKFENMVHKGEGRIVVGTPIFMPPEIFELFNEDKGARILSGEDVGKKIDRFSMGLCICKFLGLDLEVIPLHKSSGKRFYRNFSKLERDLMDLVSVGKITYEQLKVIEDLLSPNPDKRPTPELVARVFKKKSALIAAKLD